MLVAGFLGVTFLIVLREGVDTEVAKMLLEALKVAFVAGVAFILGQHKPIGGGGGDA